MKRPITITLDENLIEVLDELPRKTVASRSDLVEKLLWKWLKEEQLCDSGSLAKPVTKKKLLLD